MRGREWDHFEMCDNIMIRVLYLRITWMLQTNAESLVVFTCVNGNLEEKLSCSYIAIHILYTGHWYILISIRVHPYEITLYKRKRQKRTLLWKFALHCVIIVMDYKKKEKKTRKLFIKTIIEWSLNYKSASKGNDLSLIKLLVSTVRVLCQKKGSCFSIRSWIFS